MLRVRLQQQLAGALEQRQSRFGLPGMVVKSAAHMRDCALKILVVRGGFLSLVEERKRFAPLLPTKSGEGAQKQSPAGERRQHFAGITFGSGVVAALRCHPAEKEGPHLGPEFAAAVAGRRQLRLQPAGASLPSPLPQQEQELVDDIGIGRHRAPSCEGIRKSKNDVIPGRGRQPASLETMNTGLRTDWQSRCSSAPGPALRASRSDSLVVEPIS
jgi:hypothetical protein